MTEGKPLEGHFDAKKHSYRQTQDGVVVAFVVDPADIDADFAVAPLGTPLKIAYAQFDPATGQPAAPAPVKPERERQRFENMKPSQQAGILCADPEFQEWIAARFPFPSDINSEPSEPSAAFAVRSICGINPYKGSRAELDTDDGRAGHWNRIVADFRAFQKDRRAEERARQQAKEYAR